MTIASSSYWNMSLALKRGDLLKDEEGVATLETLADNMVFLIKQTAKA